MYQAGSTFIHCLLSNFPIHVYKIRAFAHVKFPLGMDLLKHGESAYPADAWVEQQYMKEDAFTAVSTAWKLHTGRLLLLWASLLTYCLRPSSLQLFWDHLYSTGTTTVSKTAVFIRNIPSLTMAFSFVWCFPFHAQLSAFSTKIYHTLLV